MILDNNLLNKLSFDGIPPMLREVPQIDINFYIAANSILKVSVIENSTGKYNKITKTNDKARFNQVEIY
jgi:molecular chaperone DnaK